MKKQPYIVYVKTDEKNRIQAVHSSAFLPDPSGWTEIDRGYGDRFHHAQGNYFDKPIVDEHGIYRYKLADGQPLERTQAEMDLDAIPVAAEESSELLLLDVAADHEYRICLLEMGINESEVMDDDV